MLLGTFATLNFTNAKAMDADAIIGSWITAGEASRVVISKRDGLYFGVIAALKDPTYHTGEIEGMDGKSRTDHNNPDSRFRTEPLKGLVLMQGFRYQNDKWQGGTIYDPNNGKTYKGVLSLAANGNLQVRGYIGVSLIGRTTIWEPLGLYRDKQFRFLGIRDCDCGTPNSH